MKGLIKMLKGKILEVEEVKFSNGNIMYKTLVNVEYGDKKILQRVYLNKSFKIGSIYEVDLFGSDDLKYLKVRLKNEIVESSSVVDDSSKKGIFNR